MSNFLLSVIPARNVMHETELINWLFLDDPPKIKNNKNNNNKKHVCVEFCESISFLYCCDQAVEEAWCFLTRMTLSRKFLLQYSVKGSGQ